jgi:hypothetical protein
MGLELGPGSSRHTINHEAVVSSVRGWAKSVGERVLQTLSEITYVSEQQDVPEQQKTTQNHANYWE